MKKIYIVLDDSKRVDGYWENLKDAKDSCCGDWQILEVTDIIDADYILKYTKKNLSKLV